MDDQRNQLPRAGYEDFEEVIGRARDEEARLIALEERAERRVSRAQDRLDSALERLDRAERRVEKRKRQLYLAEDELRWCREMRATGPKLAEAGELTQSEESAVDCTNGDSEQT